MDKKATLFDVKKIHPTLAELEDKVVIIFKELEILKSCEFLGDSGKMMGELVHHLNAKCEQLDIKMNGTIKNLNDISKTMEDQR